MKEDDSEIKGIVKDCWDDDEIKKKMEKTEMEKEKILYWKEAKKNL